MTTPVAKISRSFQLSGDGDGLTLSLDIVMIVPGNQFIHQGNKYTEREGQGITKHYVNNCK